MEEGKNIILAEVVVSDFLEYLKRHEGDIAVGINDFDDLRVIFKELLGREAKE